MYPAPPGVAGPRRAARPRWHIRIGGSAGWQTRVEFTLAGQPYSLSLTDPAWERRLVPLPPGTYPAEAASVQPGQRVLLTISLGEPWQGAYYKLAAAVIVLPESWG